MAVGHGGLGKGPRIIPSMPVSPPFAPLHRRAWLRGMACGALTVSPWVRSAARTTVRLSHVVAPDTPKGITMAYFRSLVQARSQQRIEVQIWPQGYAYGDHNEMQALQLGAVDMLAPSLSKFGAVGFPEFELFDLPFLFETLPQVRHLTQGALGQRMLAQLQRQGLVGLGFFDNGFKHVSAKHPLLEPRDFAGLRMRIQGSRVIAQQMRAWGAQAVSLPFSETRRALELGLVDGTENPMSNFYTQNMQSVQSDISLTEHGYLGYAVVANQHFWQQLPEADRTLLQDAMRDALVFGNSKADELNNQALAALRSSNTLRIHTITAAQRAKLKAASQVVYEDFTRRIGNEWLQAVRDALAREQTR